MAARAAAADAELGLLAAPAARRRGGDGGGGVVLDTVLTQEYVAGRLEKAHLAQGWEDTGLLFAGRFPAVGAAGGLLQLSPVLEQPGPSCAWIPAGAAGSRPKETPLGSARRAAKWQWGHRSASAHLV